MVPVSAAGAAVEQANARFYAAFEQADLAAMSEVWERSPRAVCTHPGWPMLRGWPAIEASWAGIFENPHRLQFILTDLRVDTVGDVGWVTVEENLLGQPGGTGTVAAVNWFARDDAGRWLLVGHHGSSVVAPLRR